MLCAEDVLYWNNAKIFNVDIIAKWGAWKFEVISEFPANTPSFWYTMCIYASVQFEWIHVFVFFIALPLAWAGATGVWNNKHKRDFTPLQSWKDMFLSDNSVHFHPPQTLFTSNKAQPTYFLKPETIKLHHYIWVPTGLMCPSLPLLHSWPVLSLLSRVHHASLEKDK